MPLFFETFPDETEKCSSRLTPVIHFLPDYIPCLSLRNRRLGLNQMFTPVSKQQRHSHQTLWGKTDNPMPPDSQTLSNSSHNGHTQCHSYLGGSQMYLRGAFSYPQGNQHAVKIEPLTGCTRVNGSHVTLSDEVVQPGCNRTSSL